MKTAFKDSRGVTYSATQDGVLHRGFLRHSGFTIRRTSLRPVDIKRAERADKKLRKLSQPEQSSNN